MSFTNAYNETMGYEGGYVFDPTDKGGETYKGISRRYHPNWKGWKIVDGYKPFTKLRTPEDLYEHNLLDQYTRDFYEHEFWVRPGFNRVDGIWPELAEKLFDTGVNVGTGRVSKWLQSTLNLLNRNNKYYQDIVVDGGIGPQTLQTLKDAMSCNPKKRIITVLAIHQGEHYKSIMERDKSQERFVGWFDRLTYK